MEQGIIQSLGRPGGNITGLVAQVSPDIVGKRVELIKELVPNMGRLVFLNQDDNPPEVLRALEEASRRMCLSFLLAEIPQQTLRMPSPSFVWNALTQCM